MGQLREVLKLWIFTLAALGLLTAEPGCNRAPPPPPVDLTPRVASVTPAGTDLLIGIGAADTIVGVSNFDDDREGTLGKPRIGDDQNIDWEKLAALRPNYLLLEESEDRISDAVKQRCSDLGIQIVNLKLENLQDIESTMMQLSIVVKRGIQGNQALSQMRADLAGIQGSVSDRPPIRTLIVTSDDGLSVVGPGSFLDDLLTLAGGKNAAAGLGRPYASVEPEMILSMNPDVIIQLIPDGDKTPQVLEQAGRFWMTMPDLPAVKHRQVFVLTDWFALEPGSRVAQLAQEFANILHPEVRQ